MRISAILFVVLISVSSTFAADAPMSVEDQARFNKLAHSQSPQLVFRWQERKISKRSTKNSLSGIWV